MTVEKPVTVQICDDQTLIREGLRRLIDEAAGLETIGEAASVRESILQIRAHPPGVLLLDITAVGRNGLDVLAELTRTVPDTRVLVLSQHDDAAFVRRAFSLGAAGYHLMDAADTEFVHAIREVASGHQYLHPILGARLAAAEMDPLSDREHEVLNLLALGYTNQEIASLLFMSVRTAETHRCRIMQKLGLRTRAEIVRYAFSTGELDTEQSAKIGFSARGTTKQPSSFASAAAQETRLSQKARVENTASRHIAPIRRLDEHQRFA